MISMMLILPADENKREVRQFVEGRNIEELFKDITRAVAKYRWDSPDPYFAVTIRTDRQYNGYPVTIEYGGTSTEIGWLKEGLLDEAERGSSMQPAVASFIAFIIACVTIVATFGAIELKDRRRKRGKNMTKFGEIQLRECPFCGKDPDEPFFDAIDYGNTAAFIRCSRCNMEMSEDVEYGDGDVQTMIRLAIRWNTRAKNIMPASQLGGWVVDDGNDGNNGNDENGRRD